MKRIFVLAVMLCSMFSMHAQIIKQGQGKEAVKAIKKGFNNFIDAIDQDTKPTGIHTEWDGFVTPKVGIVASKMPGMSGQPKIGITFGAALEVFVLKNLAVDVDLNYSRQGATNSHFVERVYYPDLLEYAYEGGSYTYNLDYINTDYLVRWYPIADQPLSFYSGIHLSRLIGAHSKMKDSESSSSIRSELHSGDVAIPVGATYEFGQWTVDGRFYYSPWHIAKSYRAKQILGNATNAAISVTIGYKIQMW